MGQLVVFKTDLIPNSLLDRSTKLKFTVDDFYGVQMKGYSLRLFCLVLVTTGGPINIRLSKVLSFHPVSVC